VIAALILLVFLMTSALAVVASAASTVSQQPPKVNVTVSSDTETEVAIGLIAFAGGVIGGFLTYVGALKAEWLQQRFAVASSQEEKAFELGDAGLDFCLALGHEIDVVGYQAQFEASTETDKKALRVLELARRLGRVDAENLAERLVGTRGTIRGLDTVTKRAEFVENELRPILREFLDALVPTLAADQLAA
jgi:hypothetical protein